MIVFFALDQILLYMDLISLCCFHIGYKITFIDYIWLLEKALTKKILKIVTSLKVKEIMTSSIN